MEAQRNGQHFKVECQIDGEWFESDYVFPDQDTALAFKRHEEGHGSGNSYRIVPTNADVNLPLGEESEDEEESMSSDGGDSLSSVDWTSLFELAVLCPLSFHGSGDDDLDRVYAQCRQGYAIVGEVFS